jgi:hypothetical protein
MSTVNLNGTDRPKSVRELLHERGVRIHYFLGSAEGERAPFDRETASRRAAKAMRRVAARPS